MGLVERERDGKLEVGGGGVSCRSSVTRSLFDRGSEFETTFQWTNRKLTIRVDLSIAFRRGQVKCVQHEISIKIKQN